MYQFRKIVFVGLKSVTSDQIESLFALLTETASEFGFPFGHTSVTSSYSLRCTSGCSASSKIANVREWAEVSGRDVL